MKKKHLALSLLQKYLLLGKKKSQSKGFTLIELLVAMILAALVITPLLGFMINILQTDRREQAKAITEQEMQAALDFIKRDLEEAIYIYDSKGLNALGNEITSAPTPANTTMQPVLVFWKRQREQQKVPPTGNPGFNCDANPQSCDDAFVYTLVAYFQMTYNNCTDQDTFSCTSRIGRFQVQDAIEDPNIEEDVLNPGNNDVEQADDGFSPISDLISLQVETTDPGDNTLEKRMNMWTRDGTYDNNNQPDVLVDYIDTTANDANGIPHEDCSDEQHAVTNASGNPVNTDRWEQIPATGESGFYVCVDSDPDRPIAQVFLRGNSAARTASKTDPPTYSDKALAFFPTGYILVEGGGVLGEGRN